MKAWICLPLGLALSCCEPITQGPGGPGPDGGPVANGGLQAGQFVQTVIDNASFFRQLPLSGATADMLLQRHTPMRLIQPEAGYSKVELDSGQVGYVMTAMLEPVGRPATPADPGVPDPTPAPTPVDPVPLSPIPPTLDPGAVPVPTE